MVTVVDSDAADNDKHYNVCNEHHDYHDDYHDDDDDNTSWENLLLSSWLCLWHFLCLWRVSFRGGCAGLAPGGHAARLDVFHGSFFSPSKTRILIHVLSCFISKYSKLDLFGPPSLRHTHPYASVPCTPNVGSATRQCANLQMAIWGRQSVANQMMFRCLFADTLLFTCLFTCIYIYIYIYLCLSLFIYGGKFRSLTSDNMDRWKSSGGKSQRREEQKREDQSRERVGRKKMQVRKKVAKSWNAVFFQWFVAPEGRKVGSLKRRVRRDEKWHAVVARSTFPSQNVQYTPCSEHFWKLRCWKSARRCGAKHISKSKVQKTDGYGALLDVQMFHVAGARDCAPCQKWEKREGFGGWQAWDIWRGSGKMHFPWQA